MAQQGWQVPLEGELRQSFVMEQNEVIYLNNDSFLCDKAISLPRGVFSLAVFIGMKVVFKGMQCRRNGPRSDRERGRRL